MAVPRRAGERRFLAWEYYDVADDPTGHPARRLGDGAGAVALTFAHAEAETGDPRFSAAAVGALAALTVDVDGGGARTMVSTAPDQTPMMWYPERAYPGESPWKGAALNGFMVTLLNLRGTAALLRQLTGAGRRRPRRRPARHRPGRQGGAHPPAPPARPRHRRVEPLRPAHAGAAVAHVPRRPELPLLPRAPAPAARRPLPRPRLRRRRRPLAGLRRRRRAHLPAAPGDDD